MKPNPRFLLQPKSFWANVRTISQDLGYSNKDPGIVPTIDQIDRAYAKRDLCVKHLVDASGFTPLGNLLVEYLAYRAEQLISHIEHLLMNVTQAAKCYRQIVGNRRLSCAQPFNKQKGAKKTPAYLTCIVNALIEQNAPGMSCDFNPMRLTTVTRDRMPVRTLARRVDGAFPSVVNPVAVWEIKEYYHTTTFGSRVPDGVYESLLDGMELEELREHENIDVKHYLMVDAYYTWWQCGKSYLCRLIDMLHMGYADEILFGREVVERLPSLVKQWVEQAKSMLESAKPVSHVSRKH